MGNVIRFEYRKPSLPYEWTGVMLQFFTLIPSMTEYESVGNEDGSTTEKEVAWYYKQDDLAWRTEFGIKPIYDEEGNPLTKGYIEEHFDELLEEAKQI